MMIPDFLWNLILSLLTKKVIEPTSKNTDTWYGMVSGRFWGVQQQIPTQGTFSNTPKTSLMHLQKGKYFPPCPQMSYLVSL